MSLTEKRLKRLAHFKACVDRFQHYLAHERRASPVTVEGYVQDLRLLVRWFESRGQDLAPANVDRSLLADYFQQRQQKEGLCLRTVARQACSVRHFYRWCVESGLLRHDPIQGFKPFRTPRCLPKPFSEAEVRSLLAQVDTRFRSGKMLRLALELLYGSGLRVSEACSVTWGDLDLQRSLGPAVRVLGKGSKPRLVPLSRSFVDALPRLLGRRVRAPRTRLFQNRIGRPLTPDNLRHQLTALGRRAGLQGQVNPHRFRHAFATHLLDHGADIRVIQELLGHAQLGSTEIYTQVSSVRSAMVYAQAHPRDSFELPIPAR